MTTTFTPSMTDLTLAYKAVFKTPELQAQLRAAADLDEAAHWLVEWSSQQGYCFTVAEAAAALATETALQQLYQAALWDRELRQQLKAAAKSADLCRLALKYRKAPEDSLTALEIQVAQTIGAALEEADLEEEELRYYPPVALVCIC